MLRRKKLWLAVGTAVVAGSGCSSDDPGAAAPGDDPSQASAAQEGGEGEAGAPADADIRTDQALYLNYLNLMRGHLLVGVELYREEARDAAATHMKHPEDELYADLEPGLEARDADGFGEQLATLAEVVEAGESMEAVDTAYQDLVAAISRAENAAGEAPVATLGQVVVSLLSTAAEEYDIAVEDGAMVNAHEYQDALGFVRVAATLTERMADEGAETETVTNIQNQLDIVRPAWPSLQPPEQLDTDPSLLYGAAARVELAVLDME